MRLTICLSAAIALCASSTQLAAKAAPFQINGTTWTFIEDGKKAQETIDAKGNYIENALTGKHIDHGTAVMKGKKVCFTSAMTKEGELCWTTPNSALKIGHSFVATSGKGEKLKVTRVAYRKLSMPK